VVNARRVSEELGLQQKNPCNCLLKTQVSANSKEDV